MSDSSPEHDALPSFDDFIAPLRTAEFFGRVYGRSARHFPRDSEWPRFDRARIDVGSILYGVQHTADRLRVLRGGVNVDLAVYGKRTKEGHVRTDGDAVARLIDDGNTVVLQRPEHYCRAIADICLAIERAVGHPVVGSLYVTPPSATGFRAHYDTQDSFVFQIDGAKRWTVYEKTITAPLSTQQFTDDVEYVHDDIALQCEHRPGDVLYIPSGTIHEPATFNSASVHLTVAVLAYRPVEIVIQALLRAAHRDPQLRENLPPGWFLAGESMHEKLLSLVNASLTAADVGAACRELATNVESNRRPKRAQALADLIRGDRDGLPAKTTE